MVIFHSSVGLPEGTVMYGKQTMYRSFPIALLNSLTTEGMLCSLIQPYPTILTVLETQAATAMSIGHNEPPQNCPPCLGAFGKPFYFEVPVPLRHQFPAGLFKSKDV